MSEKFEMSREEAALAEVIRAARKVQDFLWGEKDGSWGIEGIRRTFRKRVAKIDDVDASHPHAAIELRKRLLQTAALSVAYMALIGEKGIPSQAATDLHNVLPEYSEKVTP